MQASQAPSRVCTFPILYVHIPSLFVYHSLHYLVYLLPTFLSATAKASLTPFEQVAFTSYGAQSKRQRRLLHKALGAPTIPSYHPFLLTETRSFLRRLIVSPSSYTRHIRRYAGGLTLSVIYGYEVVRDGPADDAQDAAVSSSSKAGNNSAVPNAGKPQPEVDDMLALAEECVGILSNKVAAGGGIWAVDVFPSLQRLPAWLPGMGWKTDSAKWKKRMEEFVDRPYEYVKMSMKSGNYKPSFCSTLLADTSMHGSDREEFEFDLKWSANSMYSASLDTTITTVAHFMLAMMLNPGLLRRAQGEIDEVVGSDRLPTFSDRENLPYIECIFKESLRWGVPVPLNLPHRLMEDDIYNGMFIPKGSLVFGNIWAMMRDENVYENPEAFIPERFLESVSPEEERRRDPKNFVFGFGRRLCPGENLVDSSIWVLIASMIATLDISKAVDEHGNVIEPKVDFGNPIFRIPDQFKCDMRPRSPKALSLIQGMDIPL
ncbi:hypothetical protein D9619_010511 [Psilocybe cf. subviscida]|uniref:Cytochrome P450 n=1 Tax=Psilocybe cf. subviscida TaxID=2480587 RepID=A0A8H5ERV1_9AGAR|nr:hypothetical protein D9619_010511 [Psilocybe cf. subviscida]